jgi:hypothetical protein
MSRHPVECPHTDQELQALFRVADPEDVEEGGRCEGSSASISLWSHHGLTDASRHASETIGRFDCRWATTPRLDEIETDEGCTLEALVQECGCQDVNACGAVTPGEVPPAPRREGEG